MTAAFVDVDVRSVLRAGGEPFSQIMEAVDTLQPGQGLRLFAPFKPVPLFGVMGSKGFSHEAIELEDGEWEVLFRPVTATEVETSPALSNAGADAWPRPVIELDNRELDPPEPMARILLATEAIRAGEVVSALLAREPRFLFPELAKRGHEWRGGFDPGGTTYKIFVRAGTAKRPKK
jgi:uncharacterized protein (DUF2249 family)